MENTSSVNIIKMKAVFEKYKLLLLSAGLVLIIVEFGLLFWIQRQTAIMTKTEALSTVKQARCSWTTESDAKGYFYKVINAKTSSVVKEGVTSETSVLFSSSNGSSYACSVEAIGACSQ